MGKGQKRGGELICEQIYEIRYRPNPILMDHRGQIVQQMKKELGYTESKFDPVRVDAKTKKGDERSFVSIGNAGLTIDQAGGTELFMEKFKSVFDVMFGFDFMESPIHIARIGVRAKFLVDCGLTFERLRKHFLERYVRIHDAAEAVYDASIVDVAAPLNFTDKLGSFNTNSGPMRVSQAKDLFNPNLPVPDVGLYYDIDYYTKPEKEMENSEIVEQIETFAKANLDRFGSIRELICG